MSSSCIADAIRRINSVTDIEEVTAGFGDAVPDFLEPGLRAKGAIFEHAGKFPSHAVRDGSLVTGQNPCQSPVSQNFCCRLWKQRQTTAPPSIPRNRRADRATKGPALKRGLSVRAQSGQAREQARQRHIGNQRPARPGPGTEMRPGPEGD